MRNEVEASPIDLASPADVLCLHFLVDRVVDPQVDVPSPVLHAQRCMVINAIDFKFGKYFSSLSSEDGFLRKLKTLLTDF